MSNNNVLIVGAGLTGLATAYYLKEAGLTAQLIEARTRPGGRIHTLYKNDTASLEMGATWLGAKHTFLRRLLEELNIEIFEQELSDWAIYEPISTSPHQVVTLPPNSDPSYRIRGGSSALIQALLDKLDTNQLHTGQVVQAIQEEADGLLVKCTDQHFKVPIVVSTLPPYLLTQTIDISPPLAADVLGIAEQTHTWMGESIKVALAYKNPFWKAPNTSGTIFSNVGPIPEMYDHSNYEKSHFALKGFLNGSYFSVSKAERLELILRQLSKYFGAAANDFSSYEETVWRNEPFTFSEYQSHILPHQNNGHPIYQQACLSHKLFIAGSETASQFPGYMEGAVRSAAFVAREVLGLLA